MTNPTKFPIDQAFKDRLRSRGFCIDDPERRFPTRNDFPSKVLNLRNHGAPDQAAKLLGDRTRAKKPDRTRALPWLMPFAVRAGWPERAAAHDHHPETFEKLPLATEPRGNAIDNVLGWLAQVDFSDPVLTTAILGGLLMTQTVAVFQRRAVLKSLAGKVPHDQPDLFPETLADLEPEDHTAIWDVDAATRQGQVRSENQDALCVLHLADEIQVIIVCDGAGGIGGGREASQSASHAIASSLQRAWNDQGELTPADLEIAISAARKTAKDKSLEGVTTALLVLLVGDQMHYATLGDGAVSVVWPDGMVGHVQVPHHTLGRPSNEIGAYIGGDCDAPARTGTLRLEPGSVVLAMTDGASDLFNFEDFAGERHKLDQVTGLADSLLAQLEEARDPNTGAWLHSDNMTLAIARLNMGASDGSAY